ncbi:cytochrome P450 [Streptomyces plumbiresistens]|uniref:Cytochrome P450 n=1 Tax=Streptomyces plumbiresistens TaxID=511811 RepID=A0ABP7SL47_9ACTN
MTSAKRIEDLPAMSELDTSAWGGDFSWVTDDLHQRDYQGLLASPWGDGVVAYRNEDVVALQKHPSVTHQTLETMVAELRPAGTPADKGLSGFMAANSFSYRPPEHRPFKQLTAERLTPASLGTYRDDFRRIALDALRKASRQPSVDCFAEIAVPVVAKVWSRLIGLTESEATKLIELGLDLALLNELHLTEEHVTRCNASADEYMALFTGALRRSVETGEYPVMRALVEAHAAMGDVGRPADPFAPFASALADGFATLPVLVTTVIWAIAEYGLEAPGEAADADRWAASVFSEVSRIHPPVLATVRQASESFDYGGVHVPEGSNIWMMWVFANRDPAAFPEPLDFQPDRPRRRQVTFSGGAYSCTGLNIARIVCEEMLKAIAVCGASVRLQEQPSWSSGTLIHHLEKPNLSISLP